MSIRIGSSCALSPLMAIGKVVETRLFIAGTQSQWEATAKKALRDKQYLIVTPCINRNDGYGHYPNDTEWKNFISNTCTKLKSFGGNYYNSRISLVNEPMKFCTREQYAHLIKLAYPIVKANGFKCGAGNEEFKTAQAKGNMYQYILSNCQFDILDIHIQASCDTKEHTQKWTNEALSWKNYWNKPLDCTEANYKNVSDSNNYELLKNQLYHAERIGCPNFCMVFRRMDKSAFPDSIQNIVNDWIDKGLCFEVIGYPKLTSPYVNDWNNITNQKAPIPNIYIPPIDEEDDMKLKLLQLNSKGNQVRWLQEILQEEYEFENEGGYDGIYGSKTLDQVKSYQAANGLVPDGKIGKLTTFDLIMKANNHFTPDYWITKLQIYIAFGE